jgi:small subunit ribosomal protein S1
MVTKRYLKDENHPPMLDDGWWASVLADEEHYVHIAATRPSAKQVEPSTIEPPVLDWDRAKDLYLQDQIVTLAVTGFNRGGLLVGSGDLQGFVPYSHLVDMSVQAEADRDAFLGEYVGRTLRLKVIECVPEEGRIVFSERAAKADAGCRNRLFDSLQVGQHVAGEVTNITDFGVFVDLGGVEGLIHISELSWGRVVHPSQIVTLGEKIDVQVLDVSPERCRVALSLKRLFSNPWETVGDRYAIDDVVPAELTTLVSYGAFARLEEGLEGLIHVSEMDLPAGQVIKDVFVSGQKVHVRILQIDAAHQRLGLSLRLEP